MKITITIFRISDNLPLVATAFSAKADRSSYGWSFTLSTPDSATIEALFSDSPPATMAAIVNGRRWDIQPISWTQSRRFGKTEYMITGKSRTALLDSPFAVATSGVQATERSAQQICLDALDGTGFNLDWQLPFDWTLPADRVTWRDATPKTRVAAIAAAVGATLQSPMTGTDLIVAPRYVLAPWEWAGQTPALTLSGLITEASLSIADPSPVDCVYVSGTESGYLVWVRRDGTAGEYPAESVTDPYLTHYTANTERGRQVLAALANQKSISVKTILNIEGQPPGVITPGTLIELVIDGTRWLDVVMSCQIDVALGSVTQTLGFGESTGNAWTRFARLLPTDPLLTGTVTETDEGISIIELPGGAAIRATGDSVAVGARAYVQGGKIQGVAPSLTGLTVDV